MSITPLIVIVVLAALIAGYVWLLRRHRKLLLANEAALTYEERAARDRAKAVGDEQIAALMGAAAAAFLCLVVPVWAFVDPEGLSEALRGFRVKLLFGFASFFALVGVFVSSAARLIVGGVLGTAIFATLARAFWKFAVWAWQ